MPSFFRVIVARFKEYITLIVLLILSLVLISLNDNSNIKNIRLFALGIFSSINSLTTNTFQTSYTPQYISDLEQRNAELMLHVNELRQFGIEHERLQELLNFTQSSKQDLVSAKIVSRLVSKISGYFIISQGRNAGVDVGMPVITDRGLVGIITDVANDYSTVRNYQNSLFKLTVKNERSNVNGILNWDGRSLIIKNVPTTDDMEIGDRIVVSELSSIIPPQIPVGIISKKETTLSGVLSNIIIEPFNKIIDLRNVLVLKEIKNSQLDSLEINLLMED